MQQDTIIWLPSQNADKNQLHGYNKHCLKSLWEKMTVKGDHTCNNEKQKHRLQHCTLAKVTDKAGTTWHTSRNHSSLPVTQTTYPPNKKQGLSKPFETSAQQTLGII